MVFLSYLWSEAKFSDMDKVQKQRGSIVLHKETRDGADYIRIEYANSQAVALLLAQDTDVEKAGNSSLRKHTKMPIRVRTISKMR